MPDEVLVTVNPRINYTGPLQSDPSWERTLWLEIQKNHPWIREQIDRQIAQTLGEREEE